jgi:hypothetical protein
MGVASTRKPEEGTFPGFSDVVRFVGTGVCFAAAVDSFDSEESTASSFDGSAKRVALTSDFERATVAGLLARSGEIPVTTGAHRGAASTHRPRGLSVAEGGDFGSREVDHDSHVGAAETADSGADWAMTSACCPVTGSLDGCAPIVVDEGVEWGRVFGAKA